MNELIQVAARQIGDNAVQTVNARDLHAFLEVGKDFSNWIKDRIEKYGFTEGADYLLAETGEQLPSGTKYRKDYHLSLDMAKELAMVERNEKGKQARLYFIECERRAKAPTADPLAMLNDPATMRGLLLGYTEKVLVLEATVAAQAPKVAALERLTEADGMVCITEAAKLLGVPPFKLFRYLRTNEWIYRRAGASKDTAYQDKIAAGYLDHKNHIKRQDDGSDRIFPQVVVLPKGLTKLATLFASGAEAA